MSQTPDEKILHHIENAVEQLTPDNARQLWEQPAAPADGSEWYLDPAVQPKKSRKKYYLGAIAACLALCICAAFFFQWVPSASVYLDVNPSISLTVNYRNRVTHVTACNDDAARVLGDMDFRGADLDVALYAILGSMVHNGYLTEAHDTILVSVSCPNPGRAGELKDTVSGIVSENLQNMIHAGEVLSHQVEDTGENGSPFTPGKTAFIQDLEQRYPQLREDSLEELTIDEIVNLLKEEDLDYSDYLDDDDDDDDDDIDENDDDDDDDDIDENDDDDD